MASYTETLHLLKKDPVADGADTFNIRTMLNENWDAIDAAMGQTDEALAGKAPASHTHPATDITGLDKAMSGKADVSHTHTTAQITGLDTALKGKAPATHTHTTAQVTGLDTALAGKMPLAAVTLQKGADVLALPPGRYWVENLTAEQTAAMNLPVSAWHYEIVVIGKANQAGTTENYKEVTVITNHGETYKNMLSWNTWNGWQKYVTASEITLNSIGAAKASHTHTKSQITDFPKSMPASDVSAWAKAAAKPTYTAKEVGAAAVSHTHTTAQVTGLDTALAGKAASSHKHSAADITSGTLPVARGGTGTNNLAALATSIYSTKPNFELLKNFTSAKAANKVVLSLADLKWSEWTRIHLAISANDISVNVYFSGDASATSVGWILQYYVAPADVGGIYKFVANVEHDENFFVWGMYVQNCSLEQGVMRQANMKYKDVKSIYLQTTNNNIAIPAGAIIKVYGER